MFIIDKSLSGGGGIVLSRVRDNYSETRTQEYGNYTTSYYTVGGEYDDNNLKHWAVYGMSFDPNKNVLLWNRMADGTLVAVKPLNISFEYSARVAVGTGVEDAWGDNSQASQWERWNPYRWSVNANFLGGAYKIRTLRVGASAEAVQRLEAKKYIVNSNDSSAWDTTRSHDHGAASQGSSSFGWGVVGPPSFLGGAGRNELGGTLEDMYPIRLIATPTGSVPKVTPVETSLGTITEPTTVSLNIAVAATLTTYVDGTSRGSSSVPAGAYSLNLSDLWSGLSLGSHEVKVIAEANGYKAGARVRFSKSTSSVVVMGKPHATKSMATMCTIADNLTVPEGATVTREVCNNANDPSPAWEVYEGDDHSFENDLKTADGWAVNWRIGIDNSGGSTQARISTGVGMGVLLYGGASEEV